VLDFLFRPTAFFERRLRTPPDWTTAAVPLVLCAALQTLSATLLVGKLRPLLAELSARTALPAGGLAPLQGFAIVLAPLGCLMTFAMAALALVCIDVLMGDSRLAGRLAEFASLSFFAYLPYAAATVVFVWLWRPDPDLLLGLSAPDGLQTGFAARQAALFQPLPAIAHLASDYSTVWYVAMVSLALKVVARLHTAGTLLAAAFLLGLFLGVPLVTRFAGA
jgi:hypothetical protein